MKNITYDENTHKLVPLEPEDEQLRQAAVAFRKSWHGDDNLTDWREAYKASVSAAPPAAPVAAVPDESAELRIKLASAAIWTWDDNKDQHLLAVPLTTAIEILCANSPSDGATSPDAAPLDCHCEACKPNTFERQRMILCATCGNKRCPHATDHRNVCTASNEPGQKGSSWDNYPSHSTVTIAAPPAQAVGIDTPEPCQDPAACNAQGCRNPPGRCEEAAAPAQAGSAQQFLVDRNTADWLKPASVAHDEEFMALLLDLTKAARDGKATINRTAALVDRINSLVQAAKQEGREKALEEAAQAVISVSISYENTTHEAVMAIRALASSKPGEQGEG